MIRLSEFRPVGGGGKSAAAAAGGGGAWSPSPSAEDAMGFVQMVKEAFKERQPDKYHLFLRVMDDFRSQRIGVAEVASTAAALFRDTPDLALGFNVFLPRGHRIQIGVDDLAAYFIRDMNLDDDDDGN
jgi:paired amphipathic helix protein Sin3a